MIWQFLIGFGVGAATHVEKITGMLLELDQEKLAGIIQDRIQLKTLVKEAQTVLEEALEKTTKSPRLCPQLLMKIMMSYYARIVSGASVNASALCLTLRLFRNSAMIVYTTEAI